VAEFTSSSILIVPQHRPRYLSPNFLTFARQRQPVIRIRISAKNVNQDRPSRDRLVTKINESARVFFCLSKRPIFFLQWTTLFVFFISMKPGDANTDCW
jgi:hypothetical protein